MSAAKHTPGPWMVGPADDTVVTHVGADGLRYEIAAVDGDYSHPDVWPIMEANARLIAAAPDLLRELQNAVILLVASGVADGPGTTIEAARAAIARTQVAA